MDLLAGTTTPVYAAVLLDLSQETFSTAHQVSKALGKIARGRIKPEPIPDPPGYLEEPYDPLPPYPFKELVLPPLPEFPLYIVERVEIPWKMITMLRPDLKDEAFFSRYISLKQLSYKSSLAHERRLWESREKKILAKEVDTRISSWHSPPNLDYSVRQEIEQPPAGDKPRRPSDPYARYIRCEPDVEESTNPTKTEKLPPQTEIFENINDQPLTTAERLYRHGLVKKKKAKEKNKVEKNDTFSQSSKAPSKTDISSRIQKKKKKRK